MRKVRYSILVVVLFLFMLTISPHEILAAPSFTTSETVANVAAVTEVKATRTLTVATAVASSTAGTAAKTMTIGTCVVTFATTTSGTAYIGAATLTADEANCTDNAATILLATSSVDTALTAAQTAQELRGLINVSDTGHGALTVGGSGSTVSFTTAGTEASATNITFATTTGDAITTAAPTTGVIPVTAVSQVVTFTPTQGQKYTYTVVIDSSSYDYTYLNGSLQNLVESINDLLATDSIVSCTEDNTVITCTAKTAGTAFTYSATVSALAEDRASFSGSRRHNGRELPNSATPAVTIIQTTFTRTLSIGSTGDDVRMLQTRLLSEGVYTGPITGYFGSLTEAGVKAFQAKYDIDQAGIVGLVTRVQLNKGVTEIGVNTSAAITTGVQLTPVQMSAIVSQIQVLLQQIQELQAKLKVFGN